jgi:hypothetical protein
MNLNAIKNRLDAINQKQTGAKKEKIDYSKIYWKPKAGKHQIRFVPSKLNKDNPFQEIFVHYGFAKFPIFALTNWSEKDPIVEFAKSLRQTSDKENWSLARKLDPKMRVFAPIIVRGEEHLGVRLWEFGKEIYTDLLGIAADEDYGDFTDINQGFDFNVEAVEADVAGRKGIKCTLRIKRKDSVLNEDAEQIKQWLENQPNVLDIQKKYGFEELKTILMNWLNPETEETDVEAEEETEETESTTSTTSEVPNDLPWEDEEPKSESKPVVKTTKADKFDAIFEQE